MTEPSDLAALSAPLRDLHRHFESMVEEHRTALWRYGLRLTGSPWDAEDLVQDTLLKAFARLAQLWQPVDPRAYLFRIATNAWIDRQRRQRTRPEELLPNPHQGTAPTEVDPLETRHALEMLVSVLPPRQRVVVLLTEVFGFTAAETAAMIGSTEGAVKAALHRARSTLRRARQTVPAAGAGAPAAPAAPAAPPDAVVQRYLDAFNRRDPDAVAALLADDAVAEIVGVAEEHGRETIRGYSLAEWAAESQPQWAEYGVLDGRPVVLVFWRTERHARALAWVITLTTAADRVTHMRSYFFTPELIEYAGRRLGVPVVTHGYRYISPTPA